MVLKSTLKKIILLQKEELNNADPGIKRELSKKIDINLPIATIISGIRRCGKSTLLRQLAKKVKKYYYFNFEDQRLIDFKVSDFENLNDSLKELFGPSDYYFFDEIQNIPHWERFIRRLLDEGKKCIISGSNASLLSRELGTKLTGRHIRYELFPFSYSEYLKFKDKHSDISLFKEYFKTGGFPDFIKFEKMELLQELFENIIDRDIIVRHKLRESTTIKQLALYLLSNSGKEFSYNKLCKLFEMGSPNSVINYVSYFKDSYLSFIVSKFDYSYKKQIINPKKTYSIDVGFTIANTVSFSQDLGRMLETLVFLHLRRKYKQIFYFKKNKECDFVVKEGEKIVLAVQVCSELNEDNKERELSGLKEAMSEFNLKKGIIFTFNQEEKLGNISLVPFHKYFL